MGTTTDNQFRIHFAGLREFIRNPHVSRGAKVLCVDLLLYAGVDGNSFPDQETLGKDLDITPRQIENLLKELRSLGIVNWKRGGFSVSNRYSFNPEIYFVTDKPNTKYTSANSGNRFPVQSGNALPPNVVNESNQISDSHTNDADKSSFKKTLITNPKNFSPSNAGEVAALEAWQVLEPNNPFAFQGTYLHAYHLGLPPDAFYRFVSEIKQDPAIKNKGAVFNTKSAEYLKGKL